LKEECLKYKYPLKETKMKFLILFICLLILPNIGHTRLSEKSVRTLNGKSGFVLLPAKEMVFFAQVLDQEYLSGNKIVLGTLPANARVLNVTIVSPDFSNDATGSFTIGYNASANYVEDLDELCPISVAPVGSNYTNNFPGYGKQYTDELTLVAAIDSNTTNFTGSTLVIYIEYFIDTVID
jgi:hypothetical protein